MTDGDPDLLHERPRGSHARRRPTSSTDSRSGSVNSTSPPTDPDDADRTGPLALRLESARELPGRGRRPGPPGSTPATAASSRDAERLPLRRLPRRGRQARGVRTALGGSPPPAVHRRPRTSARRSPARRHDRTPRSRPCRSAGGRDFTNEGCGCSIGLAAAQLVEMAASMLRDLEDRTGVRIHLDLEPEPGCVLDTSRDVVDLFDQAFRPSDDVDHRRYLGVNHDVCHAAVMFEPQTARALRTYREHDIAIGKIQVSSAVEIDFDAMDDDEERDRRARGLSRVRGAPLPAPDLDPDRTRTPLRRPDLRGPADRPREPRRRTRCPSAPGGPTSTCRSSWPRATAGERRRRRSNDVSPPGRRTRPTHARGRDLRLGGPPVVPLRRGRRGLAAGIAEEFRWLRGPARDPRRGRPMKDWLELLRISNLPTVWSSERGRRACVAGARRGRLRESQTYLAVGVRWSRRRASISRAWS